ISTASIVGAPAQHNQGSRKGKRAWRKNGLREEERTFGLTLQKKADGDLFVVDTKGDDKVRKSLPRFSRTTLRSYQVISQRSAVPAVYARPRRSVVSPREKERLLRIARKDRRGPLNSIVDPSQPGKGSALLEVSEAVKKSGQYDMWSVQANATSDVGTKVKAPNVPHPRTAIAVPAVPAPHAGTSYNPPESAHTALLCAAHEAELRRVEKSEVLEATKMRILAARQADGSADGGAEGMLIDKPEEGGTIADQGQDGPEEQGNSASLENAHAARELQQRRKAEKLRAEKRALLERTLRKRLHASVDTVKTLRKAADKMLAARVQEAAERRAKEQVRLAQDGLTGQRLGKYVVREGSESCAGSRDRFLSMQQRALIEPRVPVLPKKRKRKTVEYEKHAWKRFV
ncbi:ribosome biogenesis protein Nop53/GLTSCR2, partial [Russula brevipes]